MPTFVNALQNGNIGVQAFNTAINQGTAPGRGAVLYHTDGNTYAVWSQTDSGRLTRNLYFSYSTDKGFTWSTAVQITSGNWDDDPALAQLNLASTSSDLALIFTRIGASNKPYVYRATISITGTVTSSIDVVSNGTTSLSGVRYLSLNTLSNGDFIISGFALPNGNFPVLWYNSTSFLLNNWTSYTNNLSTALGTTYPVSWRMHKLANGDFVAIFAGRTSYNGSSWGAAPEGTVKTDLYFISDGGTNAQTWGAPQNISSYSGSPQFDLAGFNNAVDADIVQLNDGTLTALLAEALAPQFCGGGTTPAIDSNIGLMSSLAYSATLNCLLIGSQSNGFFVYNLSTQTFTRFDTATSPAIWSNAVTQIAVSSNGAYVAVCTKAVAPQTTGSLEIFATGGSGTASTWTLTSLRTTTTPATLSTPACTAFQDNAFLIVGWVSSGTSNVALSRIDCSNIAAGFTNYTTTGVQTCDSYRTSVMYNNGIVHFTTGTTVAHYDVAGSSPGTFYTATLAGTQITDAAYDDVNSVWYYLSGNNQSLTAVTDNGSAMSTSTVSTSLCGTNPTWLLSIPGAGMLYYNIPSGSSGTNQYFNRGVGYYSFVTKTWFGTFEGQDVYSYQRSWIDASSTNGIVPSLPTYMNGWVTFITNINGTDLRSINMDSVGRMRIGNGVYSGGTLTISTFYDMVNQTKLGTHFNKVLFPYATVTPDNTIIMIADENSYNNGGNPGPITVFTATIAPDSQTLSIRADIKNTTKRALQIRAWCSRKTTRQITCQARVSHEACIKIQASIAPRNAKTLLIQASIKGAKQLILPCSFSVQANSTFLLPCSFNIAGLFSKQTIGSQCRIARNVQRRVTGHFVVSATPSTNPYQATWTITGTAKSNQTLGIRAYIS